MTSGRIAGTHPGLAASAPPDSRVGAAGAGRDLAGRFFPDSHPYHAGVQPDASRDIWRRRARFYPRALRPVLRPPVSGNTEANLPVVTGLYRDLPNAGLSGCVRHRSLGAVAPSPALSGCAAVLDQLSGPYLCHDFPDARHGFDQQLATPARPDRAAVSDPLHIVRGHGRPGLRLSAIHDPPDLCIPGKTRSISPGSGRGAWGWASGPFPSSDVASV